jgi:hypothetical protein
MSYSPPHIHLPDPSLHALAWKDLESSSQTQTWLCMHASITMSTLLSKVIWNSTKASHCLVQHLHTPLVGVHYSSSPSPLSFSAWKEIHARFLYQHQNIVQQPFPLFLADQGTSWTPLTLFTAPLSQPEPSSRPPTHPKPTYTTFPLVIRHPSTTAPLRPLITLLQLYLATPKSPALPRVSEEERRNTSFAMQGRGEECRHSGPFLTSLSA